MNSRRIVLTLLLLLFSSTISAQTYNVRVTHNTNLRASHSLESAVLTTAPAGTTLQVTGNFNRWLRVHRGGGDYWMADWVPYSRVAEQALSSDIDNCCFVDRQCTTDHEWTKGYWAYQNNECRVRPAATQQVPAQPVSSAPADIDNCCSAGWQCNTEAEWTRGYWAYQNNQCDGSPPSTASSFTGGINIEGTETFRIWVEGGLDLLRQKAPQWYRYVLGATRKILQRPAASGAFVDVANRTHHTAWDPNDYPNDLNIFTIAHEMIHEACHIYQFMEGRSHPEHWRNELECVETEYAAVQIFDPRDRFGRHSDYRFLIDNIHDPAVWWWD